MESTWGGRDFGTEGKQGNSLRPWGSGLQHLGLGVTVHPVTVWWWLDAFTLHAFPLLFAPEQWWVGCTLPATLHWACGAGDYKEEGVCCLPWPLPAAASDLCFHEHSLLALLTGAAPSLCPPHQELVRAPHHCQSWALPHPKPCPQLGDWSLC